MALGADRDGVLRLRHLDRKSDELPLPRDGAGGMGNQLNNVDPGLINPSELMWGCPWFYWGFNTFGGEHPILINRGLLIRDQHYAEPLVDVFVLGRGGG